MGGDSGSRLTCDDESCVIRETTPAGCPWSTPCVSSSIDVPTWPVTPPNLRARSVIVLHHMRRVERRAYDAGRDADREAGTSVTDIGCHATVQLHSLDEARADGDTKLRRRRTGSGRRCFRRCLACVAAQIACIATIAGTVVLSSERPVLRLQQIIGHPQSWLIDAINPRNARGYERAQVPTPLREALADFAASAPPGTAYSGSCRHGCTIGPGGLEDFIISGPTRFSRVCHRNEP